MKHSQSDQYQYMLQGARGSFRAIHGALKRYKEFQSLCGRKFKAIQMITVKCFVMVRACSCVCVIGGSGT